MPMRFIKDQATFADADSSIAANVIASHNNNYGAQEEYQTFASGGNDMAPWQQPAPAPAPAGSGFGGGFGGGMMSGGGEFDIPSAPAPGGFGGGNGGFDGGAPF